MTPGAQPKARNALSQEYTLALRDYLQGGGELALMLAYELGRKAATAGVSVLDLAMIHHEALRQLPGAPASLQPAINSAAQFFGEVLSPFEMTLRAYQSNARLLGLSETLAQQNVEIDRAREQLRTILDATTAVIYLKDSSGRYLFINRQFQEVFHLNREDVAGKTDEEVLPAAVAGTLRRNDLQVLASGTSQEVEETIQAEEGLRTYISLKFPLLDSSGEPYALCCVSTDITERKRADEALRRAKEVAEEANRELEAFSYSVAHDLRAPLRGMDGFSQALLDDYGDQLDERGKRYLSYVRESAQHMGGLIDDLLALSRVSRTDLHKRPVDLSALSRDIIRRLQATAPERSVTAEIEDGLIADGDPRLLGVALENLLGNAWKFTGKKNDARIEFGRKSENGTTVYFVRDNGAGFNMAYAEKLFGVFQRLHLANEFDGTGIGLATVHRVIRRHGGRIWGEGVVDRGATFYFTLEL